MFTAAAHAQQKKLHRPTELSSSSLWTEDSVFLLFFRRDVWISSVVCKRTLDRVLLLVWNISLLNGLPRAVFCLPNVGRRRISTATAYARQSCFYRAIGLFAVARRPNIFPPHYSAIRRRNTLPLCGHEEEHLYSLLRFLPKVLLNVGFSTRFDRRLVCPINVVY